MKIIQITDTHLLPPGELHLGLDPAARLRAVIDHVLEEHADADLVVLTGDLANDGDPRAYETLARLLDRLDLPARLLIGNHDRRPAFRAAFPQAPLDDAGFVQSVLDAPGGAGRLIFLDTHEPGRIGGLLCAHRLAWLRRRLTEVPDQPVTVFMHHPPMRFGVAHFEAICLAEPEPFLELLRRHPGGVRQVVFGHIHLPLSGVLEGGIPFSASRGCNHQLILALDDPQPHWTASGPNYTIIRLATTGTFVHPVDLLDAIPIGRARQCPGP